MEVSKGRNMPSIRSDLQDRGRGHVSTGTGRRGVLKIQSLRLDDTSRIVTELTVSAINVGLTPGIDGTVRYLSLGPASSVECPLHSGVADCSHAGAQAD